MRVPHRSCLIVVATVVLAGCDGGQSQTPAPPAARPSTPAPATPAAPAPAAPAAAATPAAPTPVAPAPPPAPAAPAAPAAPTAAALLEQFNQQLGAGKLTEAGATLTQLEAMAGTQDDRTQNYIHIARAHYDARKSAPK